MFDEETGLYYLRSRYYNPMLCRFSNADVLYNYNLMAYTANSPICYCDKDGYALCVCDGCGFGNPFASLTGGVNLGGGSCGGFGAYDSAANVYTTSKYDFVESKQAMSSVQPADLVAQEVDEWLDNNGIGKLINTLITGGSAAVAIKISAFCGSVGGPAAFALSLFLTVPIAFLGGMTGQIVENDMQPDNRFGGEMDQSDPMGIVTNGIVNGASPIIPSSKDKVVNYVLKQFRKQTQKFIEKCLE